MEMFTFKVKAKLKKTEALTWGQDNLHHKILQELAAHEIASPGTRICNKPTLSNKSAFISLQSIMKTY